MFNFCTVGAELRNLYKNITSPSKKKQQQQQKGFINDISGFTLCSAATERMEVGADGCLEQTICPLSLCLNGEGM